MKRIFEYEDLPSVFEQMLANKESGDMEFKSAAGGFPHSFWQTYSSFANTDGGTIVFGIKEKDDHLFLDGLTEEQVKKYEKDFFNKLHSKECVNLPLLNDNDVQTVKFEGSYFLFFYVPRADRSLRPVYCGLDPYTGTYRRDLDGDYHCSREEINSMFADANIANPVDGRILKNFSKDDLDADSIKQYRRKFEQWDPDHVWNTLPEDKFLEKINVFRKDRKSGEYGLTYAGLLMFGTYSAIMDENPNYFPDYQEIQDPKDRWVNRICPDGNWESNLFQFYNRVLPILQNFLPKPFQLEGNERRTETPAHVAIREALANAIVHSDYTENASLNIYKYPNKIVFSNPGIMLISQRQYYQGSESVCRNKYLQTMFTFIGSAEKAGSGVDKILHGWEELNWKRPELIEKKRPNKVVLTLSMESLLDETILQGLEEQLGRTIRDLPNKQLIALSLAYSEGEVTNERLQNVLSLHRADITAMLGKMCSSHLLEASGRGRGTRYHVYGVEWKSNISDGKSNISEEKSNISDGKSNISEEKSNINARKSYKREELRNLLCEFCKEWKSSDDIAIFLNRDPRYIKNTVLPRMEDILEKKFDIPHHPRQKYRTKS
ncbi:MAG: putative DNA binding domain-containing protein [Paludibacteraceae bacterium]|nr:putative DNA binding domain-containing protein [Paludibacteraceae bacterium]